MIAKMRQQTCHCIFVVNTSRAGIISGTKKGFEAGEANGLGRLLLHERLDEDRAHIGPADPGALFIFFLSLGIYQMNSKTVRLLF